jgi:hypothetical protein
MPSLAEPALEFDTFMAILSSVVSLETMNGIARSTFAEGAPVVIAEPVMGEVYQTSGDATPVLL